MADGFEASHVPQQSRRDKLRILSHHHQPNLLPVYNDPSLLHLQVPADLLTTCPASCCFPSSSSVSNRSCTLPHPQPPSFENPSHHHLGCAREWVFPSVGGNLTSSSGGRGLSLSLSSRVNCQGNDDDQRNLPLEVNLERERYGSVGDRGPLPLGPFTGYSLILRGSRLLKPTQKLLEELCDVGRGMFFADKVADADSSLMEGDRQGVGSGEGCELLGKKSRLISLLDEVCRRYMQYYRQLQDVVASFECVAGLGSAAPYVNLALKAMSKHFRSLKDAIVDQLRFTSKAHEKTVNTRDDGIVWLGTNERPPHLGLRAIKNSGHLQQQSVWRPQRGLPERAVAVLRAWLFEHFLHPYPTDTDKLMLAKQTGLSRCQVSNWFINARVRLWKPMVEEIHTLETQQMQDSQVTHRDERIVMQTLNDQPPISSSVPSLASTARLHQVPQPVTRTLGELTTGLSTVGNEQTHYRSHVVVGESIGNATSSGVSLTLGLHHQHNMGLGMELAVETASGGVMGFYGSQEGQLRRDVDGGHGQLLNDFVG